MQVEILFPEISNLFGDSGNVKYLKLALKDANFYETSYPDEPMFNKKKIDFLYLGPMSEKNQEKVINKLMPYRKQIKKLIGDGTIMLFTGNALEILGKYIEKEDGTKLAALDILDITSKREHGKRYNSLIYGDFDSGEIIGYKSQFATSLINENPFLKNVKEKNEAKVEGFRINNCFGTNILGPILVLNPHFTSYLLKLINFKGKIPFEKELRQAYDKRLAEYYNITKY